MADVSLHPESPEFKSRRDFLNLSVNTVGAVITAVLGVPLAAYFMDPALKMGAEGAGNWTKLAPAAALKDDPVAYIVNTIKMDGFLKQNFQATVYAYNWQGKPRALSNVCPHLGCPVAWTPGDHKFHCPCHGSVFNEAGDHIAGPAPRGMTELDTKIENGDFYVKVT